MNVQQTLPIDEAAPLGIGCAVGLGRKTVEWSIHANDLAKSAKLTDDEINAVEARAKTMYDKPEDAKVIMDDVQAVIEARYLRPNADSSQPASTI